MKRSCRPNVLGVVFAIFILVPISPSAHASSVITDIAENGAEYVIGIDGLVVGTTMFDVRFRFGTYTPLTEEGLLLLPLDGDADSAIAMRNAINATLNARDPRLGVVGEPGATGFTLAADGYFNSYAVAYETETSTVAGYSASAGIYGWVGSISVDIESGGGLFLATFSNVRSIIVFDDGFEALD